MEKFQYFGILEFKKGSPIHIKKKNRGKFTASAKKAGKSVQQHAKDVLNDPDATPLQKKRANFARNAAKWKHENGAKLHKPFGHRSIEDNGWQSTKQLKNKKNVIPRAQLGLRMVIGLNPKIAQNYYSNADNMQKFITYLNPKNWGVKDYSEQDFKSAFNYAEKEGKKNFLWRGKRYAVKRDPSRFDDQLEWFKAYIKNYKPEDVELNFMDSVKAEIDWYDRNANKRDSFFTLMDNDKISHERFEHLYDSLTKPNYDQYRKQKLDSVLFKLNNLKQDRFILSNDRSTRGTMGWYKPKVDSLYARRIPGIFIHELSHATGADMLKNLQPTTEALYKEAQNTADPEWVIYLSQPHEMGARYIENLYLKEKGLKNSISTILDSEENLIDFK